MTSTPATWLETAVLKIENNYLALSISVVLFGMGVTGGIVFQKYYSVGQLLETLRVRDNAYHRAPVPISTLRSKRTMVVLAFGQSNSANFGETPRKAREQVYNFYKGQLYEAQDPLLGAQGIGGSVWTRLGDKLIGSRQYDAVVFVPLGVGGTDIARWKSGGDLHSHVLETIRDLKGQGLPITHLLWHQGEADALLKTSKSAYKSMFLSMLSSIRAQGVAAPIYVSVATRCQKQREDKELREAQQELVDSSHGIYAGPDTDRLGFCYRYDGCHFSDEGLEKFAELWFDKLAPK